MTENERRLRDFVGMVARMLKDGESSPGIDSDDDVFVMSADDAVDTVDRLITEARGLLLLTTGAGWGVPK